MDIKAKVGMRLKEMRLVLGYSQEAFSFECGLDRTYIASVEQGKRNISIQNIEKISKALNMTVKDFFNTGLFDEH